METVAPMPAGADWQDHASTKESQMGTNITTTTTTTTTTTSNVLHDSAATKKQRPPVMVLTGSYTTPVIVGRGSQATLNLGRINKQVSRRHAIIEWHPPTSQFRISVLGQNGVRINGVGFPSGQQCPLKRGDVVDLVGVKMLFKTPSSGSAPLVPSSAPVQKFHNSYHHKQDHHHNEDEQDENNNNHHYAAAALSSPMATPTKKPATSVYMQGAGTGLPQSPASSPARFSDPLLPSSPVAARMLQKMLKYEPRVGDHHAALQQHLQSPPPSDPPTDLGFMPSPVKSRPLFDMAEEEEEPDSPERMSTIHRHHQHHLHQHQHQHQPRQPLFHNHIRHNNNNINSSSNNNSNINNPDKDNVFLVTAPVTTTTSTSIVSSDSVRAPLTALQIDAPSTTNNSNINHNETLRRTPVVMRTENVLSHKSSRKEDERPKEAVEMKKKKLPEATFNIAKPAMKAIEVRQNSVATTKVEKQQQKTKKEEEQAPRTPTSTDKPQSKKAVTSSVREMVGEEAEDLVKVQQNKTKSEPSSSSSSSSSLTRPTAADSTELKAEKTKAKAHTASDEKKAQKQQKQQQHSKEDKEEEEDGEKGAQTEAAAAPKAEKRKQKKANEASAQDAKVTASSSSSSSSKAKTDYTEMIIDTLVFARKKKSMTLSELYDEMMVSQPSLVKAHDPVAFKEELLQSLSGAKCVGKIARKGKDAYNKPLESQWYYIPEMDHNVMRKLTRQEVMPSARKCTLKDKQYFFKMPPKLPYHRKSTSPYAVKPNRAKDVRLELTDDADADNRSESSSGSSSSESDSEGEPLALVKKATQEKRKRVDGGPMKDNERRTPSTTTKKRKMNETAAQKVTGERRSREEEESKKEEESSEDSDESDEADQDSLDDLSELSGLEDHDH
ncbi:hypothetical protein DFQ26_007848 [Actinomortierella ambigua]|nr:hypothetical protein DFQ26_007848 [Actinomortierella ambigua]